MALYVSKHFLSETQRREGSFYTHDVLSKRSVSMNYNFTSIKRIYLIFLKEILSVEIQITLLESEVKTYSPNII